MKIELFNDLLLLFKQQFAGFDNNQPPTPLMEDIDQSEEKDNTVIVVQDANPNSTRVFTAEERIRFTKASHQFLVRLNKMGIFSVDYVERIINHLLLFGPKVISLAETKWHVRDFIRDDLNQHQLAFLDLVLYQKEDQVSIQ